ncbi:hypothetical protein O3297_09070 [Janthinobacterium sp. SUN128]|uniref:hypothetical protein n=1 Tax=Janthinobacterium sp. SUN128 TaxID=3014790 RepID=UPI002713FB4B|nr:hypothetical protein [Janthinobacterium sp. SUN128]MDO8033566.1 hypothetical protein [Janthinobacterium sp. SUN128]
MSIRIESTSAMIDTEMYVSEDKILEFIKKIETYSSHSNFGISNFQFGEFGHEYAGGAAYFRFHTKKPDEVYLSIYVETSHTKIPDSYVSNHLKMHALTDFFEIENFIQEMKNFMANEKNEAILKIRNH